MIEPMNEEAAVSQDNNRARVLGTLVAALDRQHFLGKRPGEYHYSAAVEMAIAEARQLLPQKRKPTRRAEDKARLRETGE